MPLLQAALQDTEAHLAQQQDRIQAQESEVETQAQEISALQQLALERQALVDSSTQQAQKTEERLAQHVAALQVLLDPCVMVA